MLRQQGVKSTCVLLQPLTHRLSLLYVTGCSLLKHTLGFCMSQNDGFCMPQNVGSSNHILVYDTN